MRADLEQHAALAVRTGTAWALVGMAFLAVLKEGFETSVFLLAAFQSSTSVLAASAGAVLGVALAVGIGIGIFRGGVRLNLARFFRITGIFLVLVAAGLVLSSLRTAHEAGWIQIGQQTTVNLAWLAPTGSVQAALLTGVLGIPADPRLIEVLGWFAYLVPTMLFLLWPLAHRPKGRALSTMRLGIAGALVLAAAVLSVAVTLPSYSLPPTASVSSAEGSVITVSAPTKSGAGTPIMHEGISTRLLTTKADRPTPDRPATLTLDQLVTLNGGRLPIGVNAFQNPGPFAASWVTSSTTSFWIYDGGILDAKRTSTTILTLAGGGLAAARTISPDSAQTGSWHLPAAACDQRVSRILSAQASSSELLLWKLWIPIVLVLVALVISLYALRTHFAHRPHVPHEKPKETYA
jgi:high-affinity iron transporter